MRGYHKCVASFFIKHGADLPLQVAYVHTTWRSLSSASGPGAESGLHVQMSAGATRSFISFTDPTSVKVAGSHSRGWTHLTGIVSVLPTIQRILDWTSFSTHGGRIELLEGPSRSQQSNQFQCIQSVGPDYSSAGNLRGVGFYRTNFVW